MKGIKLPNGTSRQNASKRVTPKSQGPANFERGTDSFKGTLPILQVENNLEKSACRWAVDFLGFCLYSGVYFSLFLFGFGVDFFGRVYVHWDLLGFIGFQCVFIRFERGFMIVFTSFCC